MAIFKKSMAVVVMLFFSVIGNSSEFPITEKSSMKGKTVIIHTNDMHGRVLYGQNGSLGIFAVAALKIKLEQSGAQVITLDAGDTFRGTTIASQDKGLTIVQLMNTIGYDAMVSGNHDYEYGYEHLLELAKSMNFPILGANVIDGKTNHCLLGQRILLKRNGVTYGIFGLVTESTLLLNQSEDVEGMILMDPIATAKMEVGYLQSAGAEVIIALTHMGIKAKDEVNCMDLLSEVDGIDIVIDGHSHSTLTECQEANPKPLVVYTSTGSYLNSIGVVVIDQDGTITPYNLGEDDLKTFGIDPRNQSYGVNDPMITKLKELLANRQRFEPASYPVMIGPSKIAVSFLPPKEEEVSPAMTELMVESDILLPKIRVLP